MRQFANAYGYEWGYRDAKNSEGVSMIGVIPDGWAYAYVEHNRRQGHNRLTIQAAFRFWKIYGTLPGLS